MIRTSLLRSVEGPFEPAYGITGGSDTKLFTLLKNNNNVKYINSYKAVTYEYVPPERAKLNWLITRAFRIGNNFVRRQIEIKSKGKLFYRLWYLSIGIIFSAISLFLSALFFYNKTKRLNWFVKSAANFGKVAAVCGYYPTAYEL